MTTVTTQNAPDRFHPPEALVHIFRAAVVAATVALYAGAYTSSPAAQSNMIADASAAMGDNASAPTALE